MTALLDANMLIALFDAAHVNHSAAHQWLSRHGKHGWATCPLTQNACIRILSQPAYPGRLSVADIARRLETAVASADHTFWPDTPSLCDASQFDLTQVLTPKYLTDVYLLGLAVAKKGRLVTFDRKIPISAVLKATPANLLVL